MTHTGVQYRDSERFQEVEKDISVLIVDDDVDSAILVESIFKNLGCRTQIALDANEAQHKICSMKTDLVILDYQLDHGLDAGDVVFRFLRTLQRFGANPTKTSVVTFSGLDQKNIYLPTSNLYQYRGHWKKPLSRNELVMMGLRLLKEIGT